jgi:hypothetical protein
MAGVSWGAHSDVMLILYRGLIRSVLEYCCIAFDRMAATHMLKLERIQYRCLRIALGLMQSTHVQMLEVIGGVPITSSIFFDWWTSPWTVACGALLHVPSVNDVVEQELNYVGKDSYQMVVPRLVASATSEFDFSSIFCTDGSKGRAGTGFGVYHCGGSESSFHLREPIGVFTWKMSAIFVVLIQIRARRPGRYLIVIDSMSSLKVLQNRKVASRTHSLVYEIKEACWWLSNNGYEIHRMCFLAHVGVRGNKRADQLAGDAVENVKWHAPIRPYDFLLLSIVRMMLTLVGL